MLLNLPFRLKTLKRPVSDRITKFQGRIKLLKEVRNVFYKSSQYTIKKNNETIHQLKEETTTLYKKLAAANDGDKHLVKVAFQNSEKALKDAFRNMSRKKALSTLDQKLYSKKKRLNLQKHITQTLQQQLNELNLEYERLNPRGGNSAAKSPDSQAREEDAMKLKTLENKIEKAHLKCRNFLTRKSPLQDESLTFSAKLDSLEEEILKHREELRNLQAMSHEVQLLAEASKAELQQMEELLYKDRKERERYKAMVELQVQKLQGKDDSVIMKRTKEEFFLKMERELPANNTRVQLPEDQSQELDDEEESDEEEAYIITREDLKRRSRLIVNSKFKKKSWKKK